MKYKITMKGGRVYKVHSVEVVMGWIIMQRWSGELRLPSGEVSEIRKLNEEHWGGLFKSISFMLFLVFLGWLLFFSES